MNFHSLFLMVFLFFFIFVLFPIHSLCRCSIPRKWCWLKYLFCGGETIILVCNTAFIVVENVLLNHTVPYCESYCFVKNFGLLTFWGRKKPLWNSKQRWFREISTKPEKNLMNNQYMILCFFCLTQKAEAKLWVHLSISLSLSLQN